MGGYWEYSVRFGAQASQALVARIDAYAGKKNAIVLLAPGVMLRSDFSHENLLRHLPARRFYKGFR